MKNQSTRYLFKRKAEHFVFCCPNFPANPCDTWRVAGCVGAGPRGFAAGGGIAGVVDGALEVVDDGELVVEEGALEVVDEGALVVVDEAALVVVDDGALEVVDDGAEQQLKESVYIPVRI